MENGTVEAIWIKRGSNAPMDEVLPGLKAALDLNWGGGVSGQVISGGTVRVGAVARWEN